MLAYNLYFVSSVSFLGDPNMMTFDGVKYDCQGEGEFTLMRTTEVDTNGRPRFEVQGRFASLDRRRITVTRGIAIRDEGTPTIQLSVPSRYDRQCPIDLFVGKHKREISGGTGIDDVIVRELGSTTVVYYPNTGLQFVVKLSKSTKYGCFLSVKACLPDDYRPTEKIFGLLGSPDDDSTNEFMKADGSLYAIGASSHQENYNYCTQEWCIRDARKSLFAYERGESFQKFNKCGEEYSNDGVEACVSNPPDWLQEICSSEDDRCLFEGCAGGEAEAKNALETEFDLISENGCGQTVEVFDGLEDNTYSGWDLIEQSPSSGRFFLGRFHRDSQPLKKDFNIPSFAYYVTMEFLLYEIDNWAVQDRRYNRFFIKVGDKKFHLDTFEEEDSSFGPGKTKSGFKSGIVWKREALAQGTDFGYNQNHKDQVHKVSVKIPPSYFENGTLEIELDVTLMADQNQVSAGVDELRITAHPRKCRDMFAQPKLEDSEEGSRTPPKEDMLDNDTESESVDEQPSSASMDPSSPVECRVAFAHHNSRVSQSFQELSFTDKVEYEGSDVTWGWSNGPLASSNYAYTFEMYTKGGAETMTPVGSLTLGYDGEEAVVTLDAAEGLWLKEIQAYVGTAPLPLSADGIETIDPTEYPIAHQRMSLSRSFVVTDFEDGPVYVVAEATVCGVFSETREQTDTDTPLGGLVQSARQMLQGFMK